MSPQNQMCLVLPQRIVGKRAGAFKFNPSHSLWSPTLGPIKNICQCHHPSLSQYAFGQGVGDTVVSLRSITGTFCRHQDEMLMFSVGRLIYHIVDPKHQTVRLDSLNEFTGLEVTLE